jgi:ATP-binding cassette subfamily C protein CydC
LSADEATHRETFAAALALLRPRWTRLALAVTLGVLALGSALALAGVSAWLITRAWQMPPVLDLAVAVVAVRALGISRGVLGYCERLASHDTALRAAGTARTRLYLRLVDAPAETVMRLHSGALVSRVGSSVDELADVLVRSVLPIAVATVLSVLAVAVVAVISPAAAALLAVCLLTAAVFAPWLSAHAATATEKAAVEHHSRRDAATMLALEHAPELRVGGRLDDVIAESTREQHAWGTTADRAAAPAALAAAVPTLALGASVLGALSAAISLAPLVAPTTLAILMLLPLSAFEATAALPAAATQLTRARIAVRRLVALAEPDPARRARPAVTPVDVRPGERLAVIGPSGCGKTTLLMDIAARHHGPIHPPVAALLPAVQAGFFAEDAHLFDTTVRDNLLVGRGDATDAELLSALAKVSLERWLDGLPDGLSTILTGGAAAVSAGQRRRLLLARALVSAFPIVLLDEPTEHLDASDGERLLTELLTPDGLFPAARAVIVATHHLPNGISCPVLSVGSSEYPHQS